ncbi:aldo/keto reductase [Candidatus Tisiphia endosymbiont of Ceraclea dissimilis]|uniref:aldo/keto reductase n=1 Tax=Candidatus Tisiphia endosymbiont of Ceraclea dissimilis TaxID=3077928 RepID=UPI003CCA9766
MQYRNLGKTGLKISSLSLGSYLTFGHHVDNTIAQELLHIAYCNGVNFFDTAEVYAQGEAERIIGECLANLQWTRDTYIIGSKVFWGGEHSTQNGLNRKHIRDACDASLKRLRLEYLDFFLCHRPDTTTSIEETVWGMNQLIQQGKVLYWGTSEWSAQQIMEAYAVARQCHLIPPSLEQFQYNMFERVKAEKEFTRLFTEIGIGATITMPLSCGLLTGKYNNHHSLPSDSRFQRIKSPYLRNLLSSEAGQERLKKINELQTIANELQITMAQMAICWCLKNPHIHSVILGASSKEQLQENLLTMDKVDKLEEKVMLQIEEILGNKPIVEDFSNLNYQEVLTYS